MTSPANITTAAGTVSISRQLLDQSKAVSAALDKSYAILFAEMGYSARGEPVPFDRQLEWHLCHRWHAKGIRDDPATTIAESRYANPIHWDASFPEWLASFTGALDEWPKYGNSEDE